MESPPSLLCDSAPASNSSSDPGSPSMVSGAAGSGRRKRFKPQKKNVDVDEEMREVVVVVNGSTSPSSSSALSPATSGAMSIKSTSTLESVDIGVGVDDDELRLASPSIVSQLSDAEKTPQKPRNGVTVQRKTINNNNKNVNNKNSNHKNHRSSPPPLTPIKLDQSTVIVNSSKNSTRRKSPAASIVKPVNEEEMAPFLMQEQEKIEEFLRRQDTAVIFPELPQASQTNHKNKSQLGKGNKTSKVRGQAGSQVAPRQPHLGPVAPLFQAGGLLSSALQCQRCNRSFPDVKTLRDHLVTAHGLHLPPASSGPPSHSAATLTSLLNPVSPPGGGNGLALGGMPPVIADIFGGMDGDKATGNAKNNRLMCIQCGATFLSKDQLKKHELMHSPSGQVSCKICNKMFANVYRLHRHTISHDESAALRKFKCPECEKAFKFKHHLKEHIRIHSGEKPFECRNCGKRFSHSGSYSSHMTSKKCLVVNLKVAGGKQQNSSNKQNTKTAISQQETATKVSAPVPITTMAPTPTAPGFASYLAAAAGFQQPPPGLMHPMFMASQQPPFTPQPPQMEGKKFFAGFDLTKYDANNVSSKNHPKDMDVISSVDCWKENGVKVEEAVEDVKTFEKMEAEEKLQLKTELERTEDEETSSKPNMEDILREINSMNGTSSLHSSTDYNSSSDVPDAHATSDTNGSGRKVRVRSLISDDQLRILRARYNMNPKPKKEELERIADEIGFNVRVVQVWFQNTRARDRREGRPVVGSPSVPSLSVSTAVTSAANRFLHFGVTSTLQPAPTHTTITTSAPSLSVAHLAVPLLYTPPPATLMSPNHSPAHLQQPAAGSPPPPSYLAGQQPAEDDDNDDDIVNFDDDSADYDVGAPLDLTTASNSRKRTISSEDEGEFPVNLSQKSSRSSSPSSYSGDSEPAFQSSKVKFGYFVPENRFAPPTSTPPPIKEELALDLKSPAWRSDLMDVDSDEGSVQMANRTNAKVEDVSAKNGSDAGLIYKCDQCDKKFAKHSSLARHKYEHSGQRPHKCDICEKRFKHKHHLTEHSRLHSGEKPFQCTKCFKRFSHSGSYSQHMNHRYSYCKPYRNSSSTGEAVAASPAPSSHDEEDGGNVKPIPRLLELPGVKVMSSESEDESSQTASINVQDLSRVENRDNSPNPTVQTTVTAGNDA